MASVPEKVDVAMMNAMVYDSTLAVGENGFRVLGVWKHLSFPVFAVEAP